MNKYQIKIRVGYEQILSLSDIILIFSFKIIIATKLIIATAEKINMKIMIPEYTYVNFPILLSNNLKTRAAQANYKKLKCMFIILYPLSFSRNFRLSRTSSYSTPIFLAKNSFLNFNSNKITKNFIIVLFFILEFSCIFCFKKV